MTPRARTRRADALAVLALALIAVLGFLPFWTGERTIRAFHTGVLQPWSAVAPDWVADEPRNEVVSDKHHIIHPDMTFTRRELKSQRVPLWNPHHYAGLPHAANPLTAVFYPPNALWLLDDQNLAIVIHTLLHLLLAGLFGYAFLRTLGLSPAPAFLGAVAWEFGGWMAVHVEHTVVVDAMVWLPLALLSVERIVAVRARWAMATLALAIGMMQLAGFPQTAVINAWVVAIWSAVALVDCARRRGVEIAIGRAAWLALFGVVGLALAAIQLVPMLELMTVSARGAVSADVIRGLALRPVAALGILVPDAFGSPADGPAASVLESWLLGVDTDAREIANNYSERSVWTGLTVLALFLAAPFTRIGRSRPFLTLWILALLGGLIAWAVTPFDRVMALPGLAFGSPTRWLQVTGFAAPMAAAAAFQRLLVVARTHRPRALKTAAIASACVVAPLVVVLLAAFIAPDWTHQRLTDALVAAGAPAAFGLEGTPARELDAHTRPIFAMTRRNVVVLTLALLGLAGVLATAFSRRFGPRATFAAALVVTLLELGWFGVRFNRPVRTEGLHAETPGIALLKDELDGARFIRMVRAASQSFFTPNTPLVHELNDAQGYRAISPRTYLEFLRTIEPNPYDHGVPNLDDPASLLRPQIGLLRVRFAIAPWPVAGMPWPRVHPAEDAAAPIDMVVYRNPDGVLPRAFVAREVAVLPEDAMLRAFAALPPVAGGREANPFFRKVWLNELRPGMSSSFPPADRDDVVLVEQDLPGRLEIDVDSAVGGFLVVTEQWDAGWRATRLSPDDAELGAIDVLRADHAFIALPLEAGRTRIALVYDPQGFRWGGLISGLALVFILIAPLLWRFESETGPPAPPRTEGVA